MKALYRIIETATSDPRPIVLAEGEDPRVVRAAANAWKRGIARIILLGKKSTILHQATNSGIDLEGIELVDPKEDERQEPYAQYLYALRKHKGMTLEQARELTQSPLYFSNLMVATGDAEGSVAGASYTTADTVRAAIQILGVTPEAKLVSSFFIMMFCESFHSLKGGIIFSDCGLVVDPTATELAEIAMAAADSAKTLLMEDARVAMLSFSTSGSASHAAVDKVVSATEQVKRKRPTLAIDGDIQLDAAIVADIAEQKIPNSATRGKANVLIFPSLEAGNIGYKLAERMARAKAIGPILQGLRKPANDLSRGCSDEDIFNAIAVTVVQAQAVESTA
ncbi:MAG: phosphate acetyltransferase [Gammaproteobacteria bacterium]|nr:phosphate acetyltransferase [Gammaproteobacteria bacterium]